MPTPGFVAQGSNGSITQGLVYLYGMVLPDGPLYSEPG